MKYIMSSSLRSPKKEERQVPDTKSSDILDDDHDEYEFESILNGNEFENLCKDENECYGSMNWDFMEWDGTTPDCRFKEEEEEDQENDDNMVIKKEELSLASSSLNLNLNLNLNYKQVLDAWCDRSPLLPNDDFSSSSMASSIGFYMGEVPEMEEERRREASVLRYKEKRHTRLFSKKTRYQVRKLNADKRPRLKGRFVKRDS